MKMFVKFALLSAILVAVYGCASQPYDARIRPPDAMNPVFLRYKELPGQKVFVVAVDPTGEWAFGYDHSRETLEEAAKNAARKCDLARKRHKVVTKAKLFAVNDEVVYNKQQ